MTPPATALDWAASVAGAPVVAHRGLREGSNPWLLTFGDGSTAVLRLAAPEHVALQHTEIAAMALAQKHGVPAPRLLGSDGDGALLISAVDGRSTIPASPVRLHALGAAAAAVHAVPLTPTAELPLRTRPIELVDFAALRRPGRTPLLDEAAAVIDALPRPGGAVFVHGDLWHGNTLWAEDGSLAAIIDWDSAGSGHPGIDLGSLRCDAAILYGPEVVDEIDAGWASVTGRSPDDQAYWDAVAAVNTPPDLDWFLGAIADQGRPLDPATAVARRDAFLRTALAAL